MTMSVCVTMCLCVFNNPIGLKVKQHEKYCGKFRAENKVKTELRPTVQPQEANLR